MTSSRQELTKAITDIGNWNKFDFAKESERKFKCLALERNTTSR
jgi:hypothetical protein